MLEKDSLSLSISLVCVCCASPLYFPLCDLCPLYYLKFVIRAHYISSSSSSSSWWSSFDQSCKLRRGFACHKIRFLMVLIWVYTRHRFETVHRCQLATESNPMLVKWNSLLSKLQVSNFVSVVATSCGQSGEEVQKRVPQLQNSFWILRVGICFSELQSLTATHSI